MSPSLDHDRPSAVRHLVVFVAMLMSVLLYLDRFCVSFAERYMKEDLQLSNEQVGWMLSAFFWTYALAQVPSGWLSDRFGARVMLTAYILLWSLFTGLTGLAMSFVVLLLLRFGFGVGQAGAYPTAASVVSKWVPFTRRGMASSVIAFGGRIGGAIAPLLTAFLIVAFVPQGVSTVLTRSDIFDYPRLCHQLSHARDKASAARDRVLDQLPLQVRMDVERYGDEYAAALKMHKTEKTPLPTALDEVLQPKPGDEHVERLLDGLNGLLAAPRLFDREMLLELPLPQEAKQLAAQPPAALAPEQSSRLNRLALEAAFQEDIKKLYVAGWRPVMMTYGLIGIFVAAVFWFCFRNRPDIHPWCNRKEIAVIEHGRPASAPKPHGKVGRVPLRRLLESRSMWFICISQLGTNVGWVFLVTWLPRYLVEVHDVPIVRRGLLASIPLFVGMAGMLTGGWLTDRLVSIVGLRWGRALPLSISRFVAMGAYLVCLLQPSPETATVMFAVVAFSTDIGSPATWAFKQDVGGRYVGSILGWGNMWGNLGAALSPPLLNWVIGTAAPYNWNYAFVTCAAAFFISGACALGVDATIPIAPPDEEESESDTKPNDV